MARKSSTKKRSVETVPSWEEIYRKYGEYFDMSWYDNYTTISVKESQISSECIMCSEHWVRTGDEQMSKEPSNQVSSLRCRIFYYGYDIVKKEDAAFIKDAYCNDIRRWVRNRNDHNDFSRPITKGGVTTLEHLMTIKDPEKRLAIWLYAFLKDMDDNHWLLGINFTLLMNNIDDFIYKDCRWHSSMKRLSGFNAPHILLYDYPEHFNTCTERVVLSIEEVLQMAVSTFKKMTENYELILYTTVDEEGNVLELC